MFSKRQAEAAAQVALDLARYALNRGDDVNGAFMLQIAPKAKFSVALASLPKVNILTSPMQERLGLGSSRRLAYCLRTLRKGFAF